MSYILKVKVTTRIRGLICLASAVPALLIMVNMNTGLGLIPVDTLISGDVVATVAIVGTAIFLIIVWWRGSSVAQEDISLDMVRAAFMWGLAILFITALVDSLVDERVVSGFLVVGFFAVGLFGLSLARFSSESGETHTMSREWVMPILASVGAVVVLGLVISAIGLGGLDDVTKEIVKFSGNAGFWILRPVLLLMGLIAGLIVGLANWVAGMFGSGDFTALENAQARLDDFHEGLRLQAEEKEASTALVTILKWMAFSIVTLIAGYLVYRLFRSRRFTSQEEDVEETRESLFTWKRANDDVTGMLAGWWNRMFPIKYEGLDVGEDGARRRARRREPRVARSRGLTTVGGGDRSGCGVTQPRRWPAATRLPVRVSAPIAVASMSVAATSSRTSPASARRMNSEPARSADAPPPKALNTATICGIAVILTVRASTTPITDPTITPPMMNSNSMMFRSNNVTPAAMSIASAASRLPYRAVAGVRNSISPTMNNTAATT